MENKTALNSENILFLLQELTHETDLEKALPILLFQYITTKISYYELLDEVFSQQKGMSFQEYLNLKYEEWDGTDWSKIQEFHKWEDAISGIEYYKELLKQCSWKNSEEKS
ncbi:MAG: hypothetical protein N3A69_04445 [Leptospiraceae bacterium]|nr:hypothetical protein [Leptospiraceae bacterium]